MSHRSHTGCASYSCARCDGSGKTRPRRSSASGWSPKRSSQSCLELILRNVDTKGSLGLNYFGFVPVLINAIQEQQDTITALKTENTSRDARIKALEHAVQRLLEPR